MTRGIYLCGGIYTMVKKLLYLWVFTLSFLLSCNQEPYIDIKETSDPAESLISSVVEVYSIFDIIDDFISSEELTRKKEELIVPENVLIIFKDSSFKDGDGIDFVLDFGEPGSTTPYGLLCRDQKYRAGQIRINLSGFYSDPDTKMTVFFDEKQPFYSGDGHSMNKITGEIGIEKIGQYSLFLKSNELRIYGAEKEDPVVFSCNNTVVKTLDKGYGVMNDEIEINGSFEIKGPEGFSYKAIIEESLQKNYTSACIQSFVRGVLGVEANNSISDIRIDFDPYGDGACNKVARITINGKSTIYKY